MECLKEQNTKTFENLTLLKMFFKTGDMFLMNYSSLEGLKIITVIFPWRKDRAKDNSFPKFLACINYIFAELYICGEDGP